MWYVEPTFDAAHRAVLSARKPLVYVCPPAGWGVAPLLRVLPETTGFQLVLVPDAADIPDLTRQVRRHVGGETHSLTGLARTARLLDANRIRNLVATPADATQLVKDSQLKLEAVTSVILGWPESHPDPDALEGILAETRSAHRVLVTSHPGPISDFIARHAHRAPTVEWAPVPATAVRPLDYALIGPGSAERTVEMLVDRMNPKGPVTIWDPSGDLARAWGAERPDLSFEDLTAQDGAAVVLADLPSAEVLRAIPPEVGVTALIRASQLPYLQKIAELKRSIRISAEYDRARTTVTALRKRLRGLVERADYWLELTAIEPLLDEYDPAQLAAAALHALDRPPQSGADATWTRIHVNAGQKERTRPGDLVGMLVNGAGFKRSDVGRIDIRETFTLLEVRPDDADRAIRGLNGQSIRGRRIAARLDRK